MHIGSKKCASLGHGCGQIHWWRVSVTHRLRTIVLHHNQSPIFVKTMFMKTNDCNALKEKSVWHFGLSQVKFDYATRCFNSPSFKTHLLLKVWTFAHFCRKFIATTFYIVYFSFSCISMYFIIKNLSLCFLNSFVIPLFIWVIIRIETLGLPHNSIWYPMHGS